MALKPVAIATQAMPVVPGLSIIPRKASLYVGDLESSVNETDLFYLFRPMGNITSVRVCRDSIRNVSLGYGYVNFTTEQEGT